MNLPAPFEVWHEHIRVGVGGARALFTTRRGGVSSGPYASLNLGRLTADEPAAVESNRRRVEALADRPLGQIRQVHGTRVKPAEPGQGGMGQPQEADGQVTARSDVAPMVLVADCLPVVVAGAGGVAVLHAGWRGLAGGILAEGVRALREQGTEGELEAAIGPGARSCCYEVGEEVHEQFAGYGERGRRGRYLDMPVIARIQLERCGVSAIHDLGLCTICGEPELFFSHRRDAGVTGRQAGVAWLS